MKPEVQIDVIEESKFPATKDTLVVFVFEDEVLDNLKMFDDTRKTVEDVSVLMEEEIFKGQLCQMRVMYPKNLSCSRLILSGLGKRKEVTAEEVRRAFGHVVRCTTGRNIEDLAVSFKTLAGTLSQEEAVAACAETVVLSSHRVDDLKQSPMRRTLKSVKFLVADPSSVEKIKDSSIVGAEHTLDARDLINTSASIATPEYMADYCKKNAGALSVTIFDEKELARRNMGGILAVGRGSPQPPRMVILEHKHPDAKKTICIAGKGVTFDSGGLSLKSTSNMETMKRDKAGACAVLEALRAASRLNLPVNVVGICGFTENMVGADPYKLGDIITTASGKTVEVLNTDAEGRIVLADCLHYATQLKPDHIIDVATLTGACVTALGTQLAGVMGNDQELIETLKVAGDTVHEKIWQLPLDKEYENVLDSKFADTKNIAGNGSRAPGAITAAFFLKKFVGDASWAHLDIAGPSWVVEDEARGYLSFGGSGFGVRLLLEFLKRC